MQRILDHKKGWKKGYTHTLHHHTSICHVLLLFVIHDLLYYSVVYGGRLVQDWSTGAPSLATSIFLEFQILHNVKVKERKGQEKHLSPPPLTIGKCLSYSPLFPVFGYVWPFSVAYAFSVYLYSTHSQLDVFPTSKPSSLCIVAQAMCPRWQQPTPTTHLHPPRFHRDFAKRIGPESSRFLSFFLTKAESFPGF